MYRTWLSLVAALALGATLPAQVRCKVYTTESILRVAKPRSEWFAPEQVERIEVDTDGAARPGDVLEAWVAKQAFPFAIDPHKDVQVIEVDDRVRKAWRQHGALTIGFATQRETGGELVLRSGLRSLDLPAEGVEVTMTQRRTADIEGTQGYLRLHIDDITAGQVLLSVRGADGKTFVSPRSVREGDRVTVDLGDGRYVLVIKSLVNLLIGEDYAVVGLYEREPLELRRIEALLRYIEGSDVVFVREDSEYDGAEAARHLRGKYGRATDRIQTVEQFIEEIGSRSSTTGKPYRIKQKDGSTTPAGAWLRERADELSVKPDGGDPHAQSGQRP